LELQDKKQRQWRRNRKKKGRTEKEREVAFSDRGMCLLQNGREEFNEKWGRKELTRKV